MWPFFTTHVRASVGAGLRPAPGIPRFLGMTWKTTIPQTCHSEWNEESPSTRLARQAPRDSSIPAKNITKHAERNAMQSKQRVLLEPLPSTSAQEYAGPALRKLSFLPFEQLFLRDGHTTKKLTNRIVHVTPACSRAYQA